MKTLTAVIAMLLASPALAADLAVKSSPPPAPMPAPVANWTGFYVGINGGYGWNDPTVSFVGNDLTTTTFTCGGFGGGTCPQPAGFGMNGWLAGAQLGYNWQFDQNWLVGLETDFDGANIRGSSTSPTFNFGGGASNFQADQKIDYFGTVRARFGFIPTGPLLIYGTGGFAYAHVKEDVALNTANTGGGIVGSPGFVCNAPGTGCFAGSSSRIAVGWTLGAGLEYALGNNLSVKAEYDYIDLGRGDTVDVVNLTPGVGTGVASFNASYSHLYFNVVRGGLDWKM
jgi:outer membrane immunogenic protein